MQNALGQYLEHLNKIDQDQALFEERLKVLTMREYRMLADIAKTPMIIKAVADRRAVAAQGVGRQLDRLRERGLIAVERYERDKRAKIATATDAGRELLGRGETILAEIVGSADDGGGLDGADGVAQRA